MCSILLKKVNTSQFSHHYCLVCIDFLTCEGQNALREEKKSH